MYGKIMFGVYVCNRSIGRQAKVVKNGFAFAFNVKRSSIAPIIPAILMVPKKLKNK
jgi:hypothetical protein